MFEFVVGSPVFSAVFEFVVGSPVVSAVFGLLLVPLLSVLCSAIGAVSNTIALGDIN